MLFRDVFIIIVTIGGVQLLYKQERMFYNIEYPFDFLCF
jgi:hypothetical protein